MSVTFNVKREPKQSPDGRHTTLVVRAISDVKGAAKEQDAIDAAGVLARVAVAILPTLIANAQRRHGCTPWETTRNSDDEIGDVWFNDGCDVYLSPGLGCSPSDSDQMPTMQVHVPRNREKTWHSLIETTLHQINKDNALTDFADLGPKNQFF